MQSERRYFLTSLAGVNKTIADSQPAMYHKSAEIKSVEQRAVSSPPLAVIAMNRMAYGARPGDLAAFNSLGNNDSERLTNYVDQQLDPASIDDSAVETRLADSLYRTLNKSLPQLWAEHYRPEDIPWAERVRPSRETMFARFVRATHSKRQLFEILSEFWHDHFNVYGYDTPIASTLSQYDKEVIRPYVLGNFREMLEANAKSSQMLYYLDNVNSSDDGPNENYARELLELHTLGAENYLGVMPQWEVPQDAQGRPIGYVEGDVLEVARCLTGWTVSNGHWSDATDMDTGEFFYRDFWHDRFQKYVLGEFIPADQEALADGLHVLDRLAEHPGTARYICRKLCRRLVMDEPPETLVESAAAIFHANWQAADQIAQTVRHILLSPEFASSWDEKQKRPFEMVVSALRACDADFTLLPEGDYANDFRWLYEPTGHVPFAWIPPNGYPDTREVWQGSSPLVLTWRILGWLVSEQDPAFDLNLLQTTLDAPKFADLAMRTPRNLANFWYQRILGYLPDATQMQVAEHFMTHSDDAGSAIGLDDPVDLALNEWPTYWQDGVRSLVALVLMSPEFLRR